MQPLHAHEKIGSKSEAKLFANDVCLRAASEVAGGYFLDHPLDVVRRTQEITLDLFEEDWAQVGFSATKMYAASTQKPPTSVVYNIWAHSTIPSSTEMFDALEKEVAASVAEYIKDSGLQEAGALQVLEHTDADDYEDDWEDESERQVIEQLEYFLDSKQLVPKKDHCYVFTEDGCQLGVMNFANPIYNKWLGDTIDEQEMLQKLAKGYETQFDEFDLKVMFGILGRLGLIANSSS